MKLQLLIELSDDTSSKSDILSQLILATSSFEKCLPSTTKAELINITIPSLAINNLPSNDSLIKIDNMQINYKEQRVKVNNSEVYFTPIEFKLLYILASRRGTVQTREILLKDVWNINPENNTKTLGVHIKRIRDKLKNNLIQTVSSIGYVIR